MAKLEVLKYPDARLREVSVTVEKFDAELEQFAKDLLETMYAENGIGLAAAQVGVLKRMLAVDTRPRETGGRYEENDMTELEKAITQPLIIINPKIIKAKGKTTYDEGCLSVPTFFDTVERSQEIELEYQDVKGKKHILKADGLLAICIQHEMDHLEGTLFIDHLSLIKSNRIKNQIKKNGYPEREQASEAKSKVKDKV